MSFTHTIKYNDSYTDESGTRFDDIFTDTQTAGAQVKLSETIPATQTDLQVLTGLIDISQVKSLVIHVNAAMTIELDDGTTPSQTAFSMTSGKPIIWSAGRLDPTTGLAYANPITADFTDIYVTTTPGGVLSVRILYDPTV